MIHPQPKITQLQFSRDLLLHESLDTKPSTPFRYQAASPISSMQVFTCGKYSIGCFVFTLEDGTKSEMIGNKEVEDTHYLTEI